jgi:chromosome segregation ATPase
MLTGVQEVLVLRDREAGLRRQLMEHWSGVMAWEVRRLERLAKNAQTRYERQISRLDAVEAREAEWQARVRMLEEEEAKRAGRMGELEEMVVEMGRRERAVEEEVRELDKMRVRLEEERERLKGQLKGMERERTGWEGERMGFIQASEGWEREKRAWAEERHGLAREQERLMTEGRGSASDKAAIERVRRALGGLLGSRTMVGEAEVDVALEEVRALIGRREKEVESLRDEMREVNMGLEEELRRVSADRDLWKGKLDRSEQSHRSEITALERQTRVRRISSYSLNLKESMTHAYEDGRA